MSKVYLNDSHAHISAQNGGMELSTLIQNFKGKNGKSIVNVGFSLVSNYEVLQLSQKSFGGVQLLSALGLHPELFKPFGDTAKLYSTFDDADSILKQYVQQVESNIESIDVIGETGLDYYKMVENGITTDQSLETREIQIMAFRQHLELAENHQLPLTIHVRDDRDKDSAFNDALSTVIEFKGVTGSFHSYTGPQTVLDDLLNLGFYVGFNAILSYKSAENVRLLCKNTPIDKILLETDSPYLPLSSVRNNKSLSYNLGQPADVFDVAGIIAELKNLPIETVIRSTSENFNNLFGFSQ